MESLGKFLKHGREEAGVTLEQLAERTRIRRESLACLESEDLENLPTDTYVRGFVKQVCRELGLHPREGLVRYETLRERLGPQDEMTWSEERAQVTQGRLQRALEDPERVMRRARGLARAGLWAGGAAVVLLAGWGGVTLVRHFRDGAGPSPRVAAVAPDPEPDTPGT
ncbi:helix-turn-helix domain-containing protein, partial [bacterium]|nr:helix-turn-helix domain-containing protein [bacterium]